MRLTKATIVVLLAWQLFRPAEARGTVADALSAIPADSWAVVTLGDLAAIDGKLSKLMSELGFPPLSPLWLAKGELEIVEGVDDKGTAAMAVVPIGKAESMSTEMVLFLPTTDRAKVLAFLNPQPVEEGIDKVKLRGREAFVGTKGSFSVFGQSLEVVKAVLVCKRGIDKELTDYQRARFAANDVSVLVNVGLIAASPAFETEALMPRMLMGMGKDALKQHKCWQLSLRLDDAGLSAEIYMEKASAGEAKPPPEVKGSLLAGLPRERYVYALGIAGGNEQYRAITKSAMDHLVAAQVLDPARRAALEEAYRNVTPLAHSAAVSVVALPEGPDGLIGMTKIIRTSGDPRKLLDAFEPIIKCLKEGVLLDPAANKVLERLQYHRAVETAEGVTIDHLVIDLVAGVDLSGGYQQPFGAEFYLNLRKVVGKEGLLVRQGAVDDTHVVVVFGGGRSRFDAVVAAVRSGKAPLAADPGIMRCAAHVSPKRSMVVYLAPDRGLQLAKTIMRVMDQPDQLPVLPELATPISIALHAVSPSARQVDVFIPTEVLSVVKAAAADVMARKMSIGG